MDHRTYPVVIRWIERRFSYGGYSLVLPGQTPSKALSERRGKRPAALTAAHDAAWCNEKTSTVLATGKMMKRVILLNYDHTFAIADTPDLAKDGLEIYKFLSSYDACKITEFPHIVGFQGRPAKQPFSRIGLLILN